MQISTAARSRDSGPPRAPFDNGSLRRGHRPAPEVDGAASRKQKQGQNDDGDCEQRQNERHHGFVFGHQGRVRSRPLVETVWEWLLEPRSRDYQFPSCSSCYNNLYRTQPKGGGRECAKEGAASTTAKVIRCDLARALPTCVTMPLLVRPVEVARPQRLVCGSGLRSRL
jgi:hypothetical protein